MSIDSGHTSSAHKPANATHGLAPRGVVALWIAISLLYFVYHARRAKLTALTASQDHVGLDFNGLFGWFLRAVLLFNLVGAFLADRVLGYRRTMIMGSIFVLGAVSCLLKAHSSEAVYFAWMLMAAGR